MRKYKKISVSAVLSLLLILAAGCEKSEEPVQDVSESGTVVFQENEPVAGWLEVVLPGTPVAIDGTEEDIWILTDTGALMGWNAASGSWSSIQNREGFDIAVSEREITILSPGGLTVLQGDEMITLPFEGSGSPVSICTTSQGPAVLFENGSVSIYSDGVITVAVEPSGTSADAPLVHEDGMLAWQNQGGTASLFDINESLLTEVILPEDIETITLLEGVLLASGGGSTKAFINKETWEDYCPGTACEGGLVAAPSGIALYPEGKVIAAGLSSEAEELLVLSDGTLWALSESGVTVWGTIGSVETRLPEADVQRLSYRAAGQTGGGSGSGEGVGSSRVSLGGVFRIYESVSSRPDPFTEFPAASRDLRRPVEDLTIEELHLVGITTDPTGGDQAMVEDANGVAYLLREGTTLRNNTRIAEITQNEVIVVQEVTVGSEDDLGGTTSIPTIFSMRLHEEGGL